MSIVYAICALVGGTIFIGQFLLSLVGVEGDDGPTGTDDHHLDSSMFFGVLTFKSMVAAMAFFGVAGLGGQAAQWSGPVVFAVALGMGLAAMFLVAALMRGLHLLKHEGTAKIEGAVGSSGTVYLKIPGQKAGVGKVMINLQNRTVECSAVTFQDDLPTGASVVVVDVIGPDTVEVIAAPETGRVDVQAEAKT